MTSVRVGRLLWHHGGDSAANDAAWNMSVDQAIAESVGQAESNGDTAAPTLRFYRWNRPTLSLGYFQSSADCIPRFREVALVRRATGGGAILHHHELTYSLTWPTPPGQRGARQDLYRAVHSSIIAALQRFSIQARPYRMDPQPPGHSDDAFLCFQRRTDEDLVVSGYKIVGSAQRREKRSILQHGSILLRASEWAPELPGLFDLTSQHLDTLELGNQIKLTLGDQLNTHFMDQELTAEERNRAEQVVRERFGSEPWWSRR